VSATARDYRRVSQAIRNARPTPHSTGPVDPYGSISGGAAHAVCDRIALELADHFAETNEKFKRDIFLRACGCKGVQVPADPTTC
jgi:hypothetical protein